MQQRRFQLSLGSCHQPFWILPFRIFFVFIVLFSLFPGGELFIAFYGQLPSSSWQSEDLTCYLGQFFFLLVSLVELSWIKITEYCFSLLPRPFKFFLAVNMQSYPCNQLSFCSRISISILIFFFHFSSLFLIQLEVTVPLGAY